MHWFHEAKEDLLCSVAASPVSFAPVSQLEESKSLRPNPNWGFWVVAAATVEAE